MKLITMHNNTNMDKFDSFLRKQMEQMPSTLPPADRVMEQMNFPTGPATIAKAFNFKKWGLSLLSLAAICTLLYFGFFNNKTTKDVVNNNLPNAQIKENTNIKNEAIATKEINTTNTINSPNIEVNNSLNQNTINQNSSTILNDNKSLSSNTTDANGKNATKLNDGVEKENNKNTSINASLLSTSEASNSLVRSTPINNSNVYVKKDSSNLSKIKKVAMPVKDTIQILW